MPAPFVPKPPRGRIPVSDADRAAARSGMDGEKTKQASAPAAVVAPTEPVAPVTTESATPAASSTQPAAAVAPVIELAPDVATELTPEPTAVAIASAAPVEPTAEATAPAPTKPVPGRRGRKPMVAIEQPAEPAAVRSVKIRENVWGDIKLLLALLQKEENTPRSIQAYVEAAHYHYEAHLRKQGKLPPK